MHHRQLFCEVLLQPTPALSTVKFRRLMILNGSQLMQVVRDTCECLEKGLRLPASLGTVGVGVCGVGSGDIYNYLSRKE